MIEHHVPADRINIIGSSGLRAENPQDLVGAMKEKTGKEMRFLDVESEVQLSIVGTIPQRVRLKKRWIENRDISVLLDIGRIPKAVIRIRDKRPTGRGNMISSPWEYLRGLSVLPMKSPALSAPKTISEISLEKRSNSVEE